MRLSILRYSVCLLLLSAQMPAALAQQKPPVQAPGVDNSAGVEFFETKVRPALVKYCYECHSKSANKTMGGLSLDSRKSMMSGGTQGPALAPGAPDGSRLIEALRYKNPDMQMPPAGKLPDLVIADFAEWVRIGAPWPESHAIPATLHGDAAGVTNSVTPISAAELQKRAHWAWQPAKNYTPPKVKHAYWLKNGIDNFILAKLEAKGLTPSACADRRTLIRRAYFDIIGLPPTPEEVAAFLADRVPNAWAKVVDRLLANPHYGERWGRYWLDLARYGEDQAHSFEPRLYPQGFRYRDWVANALNTDMPYDRFVREQIAADLLNEPDKEAQLPALGFFATGPVYYGDGKMFDQLDDRIDTLSRGVLALTVACARCHDHKYDPITQKDYYGLAGVFASSVYIESPISAADKKTDSASTTGLANRNDAINKKAAELDKFVTEQQAGFRSRFTGEASGYIVAAWKLHNRQKSDSKTTPEKIAAEEKLEPVVLERWANYLFKAAESDHDQPYLAAWRLRLKTEDPKTDLSANQTAATDIRKIADQIQSTIADLTKRRDAEQKGKPREIKAGAGALSKTETAVLDEIAGGEGVLTIPQDRLDALLVGDPKLRFGTLSAELKRLKMGSFVHALTEAPKPVNLPVLVRGNPETPGAEEPHHFLSVLTAYHNIPFTQGSGRLELANAIADRTNPLTARVMVNRVWQHHFGTGIVRTASNFGMLGDLPSHPELLDYLTTKFVAGGWSLKSLHRAIMLSATYQMSSLSNAYKFEIDPNDRLLWRMPRRRLEVEAWRDSMLAVSGTLDLTIGGPSLQLSSNDNHRRTFYAAVSRHDLDSMLRLFDFPDPNATIDARMTTTVPLQQLFVLNSEYMIRQARALSARLLSTPNLSDADRVRQAFAIAYNRAPAPAELALALDFLSGPHGNGSASGAATASPPPPVKAPKAEPLTRWEQYSQVLLSSNEFMYVD